MRCKDFERLLEVWLAGGLSPAEHAACARHAERCGECRELVALAGWADSAEAHFGGEPSTDLVHGVLERTSGGACARAREELVPLVDGELTAERRGLVELHLESCPDCRELRDVLGGLAAELTLLAEADPGPGFTEGVLARTVHADRAAVGAGASVGEGWVTLGRLRRSWAAIWPALVRRPRFALEAAYVLVLVLMPLVAWADLPERAADLAGRAGRAGAVTVADVAQGFADRAGGVAEQAESLGESADAELRTFQKRVASSLERGRNDGPDDPDDPNPTKGDAP